MFAVMRRAPKRPDASADGGLLAEVPEDDTQLDLFDDQMEVDDDADDGRQGRRCPPSRRSKTEPTRGYPQTPMGSYAHPPFLRRSLFITEANTHIEG